MQVCGGVGNPYSLANAPRPTCYKHPAATVRSPAQSINLVSVSGFPTGLKVNGLLIRNMAWSSCLASSGDQPPDESIPFNRIIWGATLRTSMFSINDMYLMLHILNWNDKRDQSREL